MNFLKSLFAKPVTIFETVVERETVVLFRQTVIDHVSVRIQRIGDNNFIGIVGGAKLDPVLIARHYGVTLADLSAAYDEIQSTLTKEMIEIKQVQTQTQHKKALKEAALAVIEKTKEFSDVGGGLPLAN
jgi:uncharacterized membrane protein